MRRKRRGKRVPSWYWVVRTVKCIKHVCNVTVGKIQHPEAVLVLLQYEKNFYCFGFLMEGFGVESNTVKRMNLGGGTE